MNDYSRPKQVGGNLIRFSKASMNIIDKRLFNSKHQNTPYLLDILSY
jgi:hypothetical protein